MTLIYVVGIRDWRLLRTITHESLLYILELVELEEDAPGAAGVDEGVFLAVAGGAGGFVDQLDLMSAQAGKGGPEVVDFEAEVVDAGAAPGQVAGDAALPIGGFEQFDLALAGGQEGYFDCFGRNVFYSFKGEPKGFYPEGLGFFKIGDDDGDVVDFDH